MFSSYQKEAAFALQAVGEAARLCQKIQQEMVLKALSKEDRSPVTVADFASQAVIAHMLQEQFPDEPLVGEEASHSLQLPEQADKRKAVEKYVRQVFPQASGGDVLAWIDTGAGEPADRFWTLDPIDGTKGFLRGQQYAVALALIEKGEVVVGALGMPNLNTKMEEDPDGDGSLVIAVRGEGSWVVEAGGSDFARMQVTSRVDPATVRVLRSYESGHTNVSQIDIFIEKMGITHEPVRMDSQAKFAVLAAGRGELILRLISPSRPDYHEKIWDQAAGSIVIEEAGGKVTDLTGRKLDFTRGSELLGNTGVLVSNSALHEAALAALKAVGADQRPS
ncbi:MAG: 3'(2'),5'-bisphosphate nucleotidase [Anaerolineales bacterium]|nr:3'(2'),5'-bisphosphate nucleotidase [Anaerolineales bacterium]